MADDHNFFNLSNFCHSKCSSTIRVASRDIHKMPHDTTRNNFAVPLEACRPERNSSIFRSQRRLRSVTRTLSRGLDYASRRRFRIIFERVRPDSRVLEMPEIRYSKRFGYLRVRVILRRMHVRTHEYVRAGHEISHVYVTKHCTGNCSKIHCHTCFSNIFSEFIP